MSSPALELAQYLAELTITGPFGGGADYSVHVSREPATPDKVVTLYDTGGAEGLVAGGGVDLRQPQVQVRVRSDDYEAAWNLQEAIREALLQPNAEATGHPLERTIGASRYVQVAPVADILSIGRDDNDRHILVANYQVIRQQLEEPS
jgi:hypothetical protein